MTRDELRLALLKATLPEVPFEGWSQAAFRAAARELGIAPADIDRAFPGGPREAIELWTALADQDMADELARLELDGMKMHQRIATAIKLRLMPVAPHREALRRAVSFLAMPQNAGLGATLLYRTVDTIWYAVGDRSTDFSFYTKRALLGAVYAATVLYWIDDRSEGFADSWEFLDRRLGDAMALPRLQSRLRTALGAVPNPFRVFRPPAAGR